MRKEKKNISYKNVTEKNRNAKTENENQQRKTIQKKVRTKRSTSIPTKEQKTKLLLNERKKKRHISVNEI